MTILLLLLLFVKDKIKVVIEIVKKIKDMFYSKDSGYTDTNSNKSLNSITIINNINNNINFNFNNINFNNININNINNNINSNSYFNVINVPK